jgi:stage IV sporulation protein FB
VFLLEPNETPYDLRWHMFGIPVRVHPMFWLITLIMGWGATERGLQYLAIWIGCVFVSILIHELGHVWMGQVFGSHGHIVLYGFGGLAIGSNHLHSRAQRIAVCFAGPLAGFLFLSVLFALLWARDQETFPAYLALAQLDLGLIPADAADLQLLIQVTQVNPVQFAVVYDLILINLLWGLVNLLPVWPLDGGQISRDVCEGVSRDRGLNVSLVISIAVAALLAVHSLLAMKGIFILPFGFGSTYTAILFGLLALQSFQLLQQAHSQRRWTDDHWHDPNDW